MTFVYKPGYRDALVVRYRFFRPKRALWAVVLATFLLATVLPASASESSGAAAWGLNNDGQLGNGTTTTEKEAVAVKVLTEATAVAGGELHSLALLKSGKVMAWGDNADGQLGNGTTTTEKEPVEVKGLTEVVAIAAGADHSLALLKSGKVKAWGLNTDGQLGNGTTTTEKEPVEVKGITEAVAIAAGSDHSLAVLKSGKVVAWGDNNDGQLGNGTTTTEKEPVEVKGITEAAAVAGGEFHSLALLKTGKVMAWGDDADGQLGNGTTTTEKEPVEVKGITEATAVAAGHSHSLAVLKSGKVMAWGDNNDGQLGNGTTTTEKEPVEVKGIAEATAVAGGEFHSLALLKTGKVMAWGDNVDGQLGNGTTTTEKEPVEVKALSGVVGGISAGANFSLASYATKPANTELPVISGEAKDEKTLTASTGTWTGTPTITYTYQWESCNTSGEACSNVSGATSSTYAVAHEQVGHTIRVKVTAKNSVGEASATSAQTATVAASPPANTVLPTISGEAKDEKPLTASTGTWTGTPTITYTYQWENCNTSGESCTSITGATASSYTIAHEQVGHTIRVKVTAKNSAGEASATSAQTATVAASPPANTVLPTISGEAKDEKTLMASTGTWTGTPTITYTYQWESCNASGESCTSITGATSSTYTIAHEQVGHTIKVKVTATNVAGEASATSAATATVAASAPANTVLPVISGEAKDEKTLSSSTGTWTGTPTITYSYQWQSCNTSGEACSNISGATSSSYTIAHEQVGHTIRVKVTATNAAGSASSTSNATSVVAAAAPQNTVAPSISGEVVEGSTLTASVGSWAGTPTISYSYHWQTCSLSGQCNAIEGATGSTYSPRAADVGHTIEVLVVASNASGSVEATSAKTAVVEGFAEGSACTDTWTGGAGNDSWDTAGNWATGSIPGADDHACILSNNTTVAVSGHADQVGWLTDEGTLEVTSGSLSINGPSTSTLRGLTVTGATLTGAGTVDVTGSFSGGGYGTLSGSGSLVIEPGATGTVTPTSGAGLYLEERTLSNAGTLTVGAESGVEGLDSARLLNSGTLVVNGEGGGRGLVGPEGEASLTNTGTLTKTEGTGTSPIRFAIDNEGSVTDTAGDLEFTSPGTSGASAIGSWNASGAGAAIMFDTGARKPFALGATVPMSGSMEVIDGTVTAGEIEGSTSNIAIRAHGTLEVTNAFASSTLAGISVEGGLLTGTGTIDVTSAFSGSRYGTLSGKVTLDLEAGAAGTIGPERLQLLGATVINSGSLSVPSSTGIRGGESGKLINKGTLTVNAQGSGNGLVANSGEASLTNTGTLQKTEGSESASIGFAIDNEGEVSATAGQLEFTGGGAWGGKAPGSWSSSGSGADVVFAGGTFSLGSTTTMSGAVTVTGSASVEAGQVQGANASVTVTGNGYSSPGGRLEIVGPGVSTLGNLTISGAEGTSVTAGSLTGPGEVDVSGAFSGGRFGSVSGQSTLVLEEGATGTISDQQLVLRDATLVNGGSLTIPKETTLLGEEGGRIVNTGRLNVDAVGPNEGLLATAGPRPSLTNTGTLEKGEGGGSAFVGFAIDNEGLVRAGSGHLVFEGGGNSGQITPETWSAANGATIVLGNFPTATYSLGASSTLEGHTVLESDVTAGTIEGTNADVTWEIGNLTLTGITPTTFGSLTVANPELRGDTEQKLSVETELDVDSSLLWASNSAELLGPGAIVAGDESTTAFNASAEIHLPGGDFVNRGTATWESGGIFAASSGGSRVPGDFFENYGTFNIEQDGSSPVVYACTDDGCATFVNYGTTHPEAFPKIQWRASIIDYGLTGHFEPNYEEEPNCYTEPEETRERCLEAIDDFPGVMLEEGATIEQAPWYRGGLEIPGTPEEGRPLRTEVGRWKAKPGASFSYQWERCGGEEPGEVLGGGCVPIEGATSRSYTPTAGDVGYTLRVVVTGTNHLNSETVTSPATAVIVPVPTIEGEPEEGQTLTAHINLWATTPPRSVSYQWQVCGGEGEEEVHSTTLY